MIHPAFEHIVGQDNIRNLLSLSLSNYERETDLIQPFLIGEAGLGKTEIARAYGQALAEMFETEFVEFATPSDFRLVTDFKPFLEMLEKSEKYVIYIDEYHELDPKMIAHAHFSAFLRKGLDRQNTGKTFQVLDKVLSFNRKKQVFIISSNQPDKVDNALKSRMNTMTLVPYSMKQIEEITRRILEKNGMECDYDQTLSRIAACGRGTARPIVNLVHDVFKLFNVKVIDNESAMHALRLKEMYPAGLRISEVRLVDLCQTRYTRLQILSNLTDLVGSFSESMAYLIQKGLIAAYNNGFETTEKGKKYLTYIEREKFTWQ
jgi:Holliday junction resolvasome RuvABC ATP-dependent DNA helicase subunit